MPDGTNGGSYPTQSLTASGATAPYAFAVTTGALPGGLTLSSSGVLSGTPNAAGSYTFTVRATDSTPPASGGPFMGSRIYSVTISNRILTVAVAPSTLPDGTYSTVYPTQNITASGATTPYSFAVTTGALPAGLTLSSSGVLSGTPNAAGSYTFTVRATDSTPPASGGPFTGSRLYAVTIGSAGQVIVFAALPNRPLGVPDFAISATASGGAVVFTSLTPTICSVSGSLVHLVAAGICTIAANQSGNANYNAAPQATQSFTVFADATPPNVVSLTRDYPSPTMSDLVTYTLAFSEVVTGVTSANFSLSATGISGAGVTAVDVAGAAWTVTVNTGRGTGQLRLDFAGGPTIRDLAGNPLATSSVSGETYDIDKGGTVIGTGQGRPDPAFGINGYALFAESSAAPAVAVLPDGRILAAGAAACDVETCTLQLARYLANGAPDLTFGSGGKALTSLSGISTVNAPIINNESSFFIQGMRAVDFGSGFVPFLAKFSVIGTPAASFGVNGVAALDSLSIGPFGNGSSIDGAGRVLIAATTPTAPGGTDVIVVRLTAAGVIDTTFGSNGVARIAISSTGNKNDRGADVAVQPDGKILVGGRTIGTGGIFDFLLLRLDANGVLDPTFGAGGIATARFFSSGANAGRRLALQPDGRILVVGEVSGSQCGIARFNSNGVLDVGFGTGGKMLLPLMQFCTNIALEIDGKFVLTGSSFDADVIYGAIARSLADGTPDPTFGYGGLIEITEYDGPARAAITTSGNIVTSLVIEDRNDGVQKAYVVQLAARLAQVTTTAITDVAPGSTVTGQPYAVTVSVASASGVPDGAVVVTDGLGASCTIAALSTGTGSCTLASRAAGTRTLTATYGGTPSFRGSTGTLAHVVRQADTKTDVVPNMNPAQIGAQVTFTATTVAWAQGGGVPAGSVAFSNDKTVLGTVTLDASGNARFATTALPAGTTKIVASYLGDANYKDSKSGPLSETIEALPVVEFSTPSVKVDESVGTMTLTVNRVGSVIGPMSVAFATANGTATAPADYAARSGTLNWSAGDGASKIIAIPIVADNVAEPDETFSVTLSAPVGATIGATNAVVITIKKN